MPVDLRSDSLARSVPAAAGLGLAAITLQLDGEGFRSCCASCRQLPWVARAYPRYARVPWRKGGGVMTQVTEHLQPHGVPFEPIAHQRAYTSIDEARALGIDASEVLKTVAMRVAGGYVLMVIPATCRLDMHLAQAAAGDRHVRLATEQEL